MLAFSRTRLKQYLSTFLGVDIVILGLMTLTLFQGHRCVRNINCKPRVLDCCLLQFKHCIVTTHIKKIVHKYLCDSGEYSREIIKLFLIGQVSGLMENFNIRIYSDTIIVINLTLCMAVILTIFQCHSSVEQF